MIDGLPPKAVLKAVALERRMLEEDLALGRTFANKDAPLILSFCKFLESVVHGRLVLPSVLPVEHWAFYGKTVERLATAGELRSGKLENFEAAPVPGNC